MEAGKTRRSRVALQPGRTLLLCGVLGLMILLAITPGISFTEDLGRHLLMGRLILETGSVPDTNYLTYTVPDFPVINHHWLSQVFFYSWHRAAGFNGLIGLKMCIMVAALWLALTATFPRRGIRLYHLTGILCAVLLGYRSHIRPELFTYFFVALYLWIFSKARQGNTKIRWWIIPVACLWVNLHIYFIFGLGMVGAFALERWWGNRNRKSFFEEVTWLLSIVIVSCINPSGIRGVFYPFTILHNYGIGIVENQSPLELWNIAINPMLLALPLVSLAAIGAIITLMIRAWKATGKGTSPTVNQGNGQLSVILITSAALIAAWWMSRNVPLLALTVPPLLASALNGAISGNKPVTRGAFRSIRYVSVTLIVVLNGWLCYAVVEGSYFRIFPAPNGPAPFGFDDEARYSRLSHLARDHGLTGPVFTDFRIGSLVEYELYPEPGYVDNRPEAFPETFWSEEYTPVFSLGPEFESLMESRRINAVLISTAIGQGFIGELLYRPEWVLVHIDEIGVVFVRNCEKNRGIIEAKAVDSARLSTFERDISERLNRLPDLPLFRRQVETEILALRLYGLVCIGEQARAWPYLWQLYERYPDYDAVHEIIYVCVPREYVTQVEPIFARRARWPLSAKHVLDWGNYLLRQGKKEAAQSVFRRGRIFFPLDPALRKAVSS
jgi:hypothetical protein